MVKHTTPSQKTESLRLPKNADVRSREYLRPEEVEMLISAAKSIGRHKNRDTLLILMMFRHGLRVNEALDLLKLSKTLLGDSCKSTITPLEHYKLVNSYI